MKKDLQNRVAHVAGKLMLVVATVNLDKLNSSFNFMDKLLQELQGQLPDEAADLLVKSRASLTESWKYAIQAGKLVSPVEANKK
jgi:hypothetical protein